MTVDKWSSSPLNLHPYLFPCPPVVWPCWRTSWFMFRMTHSFSLPYSCRPNKLQVYDSWLLPYLILPAMYLQFFSCIFTSCPTFLYIWINIFQTFPDHPQGLMVKKCMCFDQRRDLNPHPSCLLTFSKLFLTRTLTYLWVF